MKIKSLLITVVLATVILGFGVPVKTFAADCMLQLSSLSIVDQISCLQQTISDLMAQIQQLQAQQNITTPAPADDWCYTFNTNIKYGNRGAEISALHNALQDQGFYIGVSELESQYFGDYTTIALNGFQEKYASEILAPYRLTRGTGYVGTTTRAKLNALYGCSRPISPPVLPPYQTPTCTSFTYSNYGPCSLSGTQTRSVTSYSPIGCTGGNPITSQTCTYIPPVLPTSTCEDDNWQYSLFPSTCPPSGTQIKTWIKIGVCTGGVSHSSIETVSCSSATSICNSFIYSDYGQCSPSGVQTRTVTSAFPLGCGGGNRITSQACTYSPPCDDDNWTSSLSPTTCPSSGTQIKTWTKLGTCSGGVSHSSTETVSCNPQTPTCTSFTYSNYGPCFLSGVQTRTVTSSSPSGCTGGNPITSQACTYIPPVSPISTCDDSNWMASSSVICPSSGFSTRTWTKLGTCTGGVSHPSTEIISCNSATPTCTSFTYSNYGSCSASGTQTRTVTSSSPSGCTGGNPITSQACTYIPPCSDNDWSYLLSPTTCPSSGVQTKTWIKIGDCTGGVSHSSIETVSCTSICTSFTYSNYSPCFYPGRFTRIVASVFPLGCTGGNPITSQTCTYTPPVSPVLPSCKAINWTFSLYPSVCPSSGAQTKTWTNINTCSGGFTRPPTETISCTPPCTSFLYSDWGSCSSSGIQTRSVTSSSPSGCTGGNPITSQACTYIPLCDDNNWTFSLSPTICPSSGTQTKTWTNIGTCSGGVSHPLTETVSCNYQYQGPNLPPIINSVSGPTKLNITALTVGAPGSLPKWTINASDPENETLNYSVIWGDGKTSDYQESSTFNHQWLIQNTQYPGTHIVQFLVKDATGNVSRSSLTIEVKPAYTYACSDDGWNYFSRGITKGTFNGQSWSEKTDYCSDSNTLIEYTCDGDNIVPVTRTCKVGCLNGACIAGFTINDMPSVLTAGSTYNIQWSSDGLAGIDSNLGGLNQKTNVYLYLINGNFTTLVNPTEFSGESALGAVSNQTNNFRAAKTWLGGDTGRQSGNYGLDGSFEWRVPQNMMPGDNYKIMVQTPEGDQAFESNVFSIINNDKYISISSPSVGQLFGVEDNINIAWSTAGFSPDAKLNMALLTGGTEAHYYLIARDVPANQGFYSWKIPSSLNFVYGSEFKIWIGEYPMPESSSGGWAGGYQSYFSNSLAIRSSQRTFNKIAIKIAQKGITLSAAYAPFASLGSTGVGRFSTSFSAGQVLRVVWTSKSVDKVNIILVSNGYRYHVVATDVSANKGYHDVVLTEEIINYLTSGGRSDSRVWVGEYKPSAQGGNWDSIKASAYSGAYSETFYNTSNPSSSYRGDIELFSKQYLETSGSSTPYQELSEFPTSDWTNLFEEFTTRDYKKLTPKAKDITVNPMENSETHSVSPSNPLLISWTSTIDSIKKVNIYLVKQGSSDNYGCTTYEYSTIANDVPVSQGSYSWTPFSNVQILAGSRLSLTPYSIWVGEYKPSIESASFQFCYSSAGSAANRYQYFIGGHGTLGDAMIQGLTFGMSRTFNFFEQTCTPNWQCTNWVRNSQTNIGSRTCNDLNNCGYSNPRCLSPDSYNCGDSTIKPPESQTPSWRCLPYWQCSDWSSCVSGQQRRSCSDLNQCNSLFEYAPFQVRSCSISQTPITETSVGEIVPSFAISYPEVKTTFTATYLDPDGWDDLKYVSFLIDTDYSNDPRKVWIHYRQSTNQFGLVNDAGNMSYYCTPGSNGFIENSYAKLDCSASTASGSGNSLTLTLVLYFKENLIGDYNTYLYAKDNSNTRTGWIDKGDLRILNNLSANTIQENNVAGSHTNPLLASIADAIARIFESIKEMLNK